MGFVMRHPINLHRHVQVFSLMRLTFSVVFYFLADGHHYSYIAIVYPLRPRMGKSTARIAISLIWCASCILAIPCLLYSQTISRRLDWSMRSCGSLLINNKWGAHTEREAITLAGLDFLNSQFVT